MKTIEELFPKSPANFDRVKLFLAQSLSAAVTLGALSDRLSVAN